MLPGIAALFVLLAVLQMAVVRLVVRRSRLLGLLAIILTLIVAVTPVRLRLLAYGTSLAPTSGPRRADGALPPRGVASERRPRCESAEYGAGAGYPGKPVVRGIG